MSRLLSYYLPLHLLESALGNGLLNSLLIVGAAAVGYLCVFVAIRQSIRRGILVGGLNSLRLAGAVDWLAERKGSDRREAIPYFVASPVGIGIASLGLHALISPTPEGLTVLTVSLWAIWAGACTMFVYCGIFFTVKQAARKTRTEVDDVLLDILAVPSSLALFLFLFLTGIPTSLAVFLHSYAQTAYVLLGIVVAWRILRDLLLYYLARYAAKSSSAVDDVLLPIVRQILPIILFVTGAVFILNILGVDTAVLLTFVGGGSFILAFGLQDTIRDIYSGIALAVDAPFGYGDLIILEDGTICQVRSIGLRMTTLYNTEDHSYIFMPNVTLVKERIVNITRPSPDLQISLEIGVGYDTDPAKIRKILREVAQEHPHTLGDPKEKLPFLWKRVQALRSDNQLIPAVTLVKECNRIKAEARVNELLGTLLEGADSLADRISDLELGGLDEEEKIEIGQLLAKLHQVVAQFLRELTFWIYLVRYNLAEPGTGLKQVARSPFGVGRRIARYNREVWRLLDADPCFQLGLLPQGEEERFSRRIEEVLGGARRAAPLSEIGTGVRTVPTFGGLRPGIRHLDQRDEFAQLLARWNRKAHELRKSMTRIERHLRFGNERRLDDRVRAFRVWLHSEFREWTPSWKNPRTPLVAFDESSLLFKLRVYINDITLEHFTRRGRVATELRLAILAEVRKAEIEIPFPQRVVWLREESASGESEESDMDKSFETRKNERKTFDR